jgi:hypothetical protein
MNLFPGLLLSTLLLAVSAPPAQAKGPAGKAGSVRVYRFDNLDVEGKVKAPQLMYFLKRIRSNFRSFRLPKQHFVKKIVDSKTEEFL